MLSKFNTYKIAILLVLLAAQGRQSFAQNENTLLHPVFYDEYNNYQVLPNGGMRVFTIADHNNFYGGRHPAYFDILPDQSLEETQPVDLIILGITGYTDQLLTLPLKDGGMLVTNTSFDCDFGFPGGLLLLDKNGEVQWVLDYEDVNGYVYPSKIVFGGADYFIIQSWGSWSEDPLFVSVGGEVFNFTLPNLIYDETMQTDDGFITAIGDQLYVLDHLFNQLTAWTLEGGDIKIFPLGQEYYLIRGGNSYYILDPLNILEELPIPANSNRHVYKSGQFYWSLNFQIAGIVKYDNLFTPVDTLYYPAGFYALTGIGKDDDVMVAGTYENTLDVNVLAFKGNEQDMNLNLQQDIGVTDIHVDGDILAVESSGLGYDYAFNDLVVTVKNFGTIPVNKFTIRASEYSYCFWCNNTAMVWDVDNIILLSGESTDIHIGAFNFECVEALDNPFCLSAIAPNDKADGNYLNDKHCVPVNIIYTATDEPNADKKFKVYPNPVTDELYVLTGSTVISNSLYAVFSSTGMKIQEGAYRRIKTLMSVNFPPGFILFDWSMKQDRRQ